MGAQLVGPVPVVLGDQVALALAPVAVPAGFPSPAQDYYSGDLDLTAHLVRDRVSTFVWRVAGHSMTGAGIHDGDLLLVDRGIRPVDGHVVVAVVDGECTVKRLRTHAGRVVLCAASPDYPDLQVGEWTEMTVWGVVTWVLHRADPHDRP